MNYLSKVKEKQKLASLFNETKGDILAGACYDKKRNRIKRIRTKTKKEEKRFSNHRVRQKLRENDSIYLKQSNNLDSDYTKFNGSEYKKLYSIELF